MTVKMRYCGTQPVDLAEGVARGHELVSILRESGYEVTIPDALSALADYANDIETDSNSITDPDTLVFGMLGFLDAEE